MPEITQGQVIWFKDTGINSFFLNLEITFQHVNVPYHLHVVVFGSAFESAILKNIIKLYYLTPNVLEIMIN